MSLPAVLAFGGSEVLHVREWCGRDQRLPSDAMRMECMPLARVVGLQNAFPLLC